MFKIDTEGLLEVFRKIADLPKKIKVGIVEVVNVIGEALVAEVIDDMSAYSGISVPDIRSQMNITEATEANPTFEMDASLVVPDPTEWARPWVSRGSQPFDSNVLVNIITAGDDKVCPICVSAARNNPYTLAETNKMFAKWAHTLFPGLLHPHCRCTLEPTDLGGRKPFGTGGPSGGGGVGMPRGLLDMRRIGNAIADQITTTFRK